MITSCDQHQFIEGKDFSGLKIIQNFISSSEAEFLVKSLDENQGLDPSQSGRRKKNFGPKINFKKRKIRVDNFTGFYDHSSFIRRRLNELEAIRDMKIVEECFLEYENDRGSHIEPHIDDCWIW